MARSPTVGPANKPRAAKPVPSGREAGQARLQGESPFAEPLGKPPMIEHRWTALVSLLALLTYFWMSTQVPRARIKCGIHAPAMSGDPLLERTIRVHYNTLEWLPIFLVSLWMFAIYWSELVAAALGVVWILARIFYALSYYAAAERRGPGFLIQAVTTAVLLFGALGRIVYGLATGSA